MYRGPILSGQIGVPASDGKHQFIGNTRLAELKRPEQSTFFMRHQDGAKMFAQIHAPALMGFGSTEVPHVVMPLHQDETIFIVLGFPESNVPPFQRNQFTFTEPRPEGSEEQRMIIGANFHACIEKGLGLTGCHSLRFALAALTFIELAHL